MMEKSYDFKIVSLKYQKVLEDHGCKIDFFKSFIKYTFKFQAEEPIIDEDENSGWESINTDFEVVALKKNIAGVEKSWMQKSKRWKVTLIVYGFQNDLMIYFKKESEAAEVFNQLLNYITDGDTN